jgi:hypothetical protein
MKFPTSALILCVAIDVLPAFGQSLPEHARQYGGSATNAIDVDVPVASPPELMVRADLVIRGRVAEVTTRLNADESNVITEYSIVPIQAFKERRTRAVATLGAVSKIVIRRTGGQLVTPDGLRLATSINIYPDAECFAVGEEIVAFLTYHTDTDVYSFTNGEFGAFRVRDGKVSPMTKDAAVRRQVQPIDAGVFFTDMQRAR